MQRAEMLVCEPLLPVLRCVRVHEHCVVERELGVVHLMTVTQSICAHECTASNRSHMFSHGYCTLILSQPTAERQPCSPSWRALG